MTDQPTTRVSIDTPPLTVTVEHPTASILEVREQALEIYHKIWRDDMRTSLMGGIGFDHERRADE